MLHVQNNQENSLKKNTLEYTRAPVYKHVAAALVQSI